LKARSKIKSSAMDRLKRTGEAALEPNEQKLLSLKYDFKADKLDAALSGYYVEKKKETKTDGWVSPSEHPEGKLTKPCPECGYKYGTAWKSEEVPQSVIDFLFSLPDTDMRPAWV